MADENNSSLSDKWLQRLKNKPFIALLIVAAIVIGGIITLIKDVKELPGVVSVISYLSRASIPDADPKRFSILVTHLEDDKNGENERLIIEALKEFKGIQVLSIDRIISLKGPVPEELVKKGNEIAQTYLKKSWKFLYSSGVQ